MTTNARHLAVLDELLGKYYQGQDGENLRNDILECVKAIRAEVLELDQLEKGHVTIRRLPIFIESRRNNLTTIADNLATCI